MAPKSKFTDKERREMRRLYENGEKTKDIALRFGCGTTAVRKQILAAGGAMNHVGSARRLKIEGQQYGRLTALRCRNEIDECGNVLWDWFCSCGNSLIAAPARVRYGLKRSCGCLERDARFQRQRVQIAGQKFGMLTALRRIKEDRWLFLCDCGNERPNRAYDVTSGRISSCGCAAAESTARRCRKDYAGQKAGMLTAVSFSHSENKRAFWVFKCDCGNTVTRKANAVFSGNTQSCGCLDFGPKNATLAAFLKGTFYRSEKTAIFYINKLKRFAGYLKVGIDSTGKRDKDDEYGERLAAIQGTRLECWLIEQAILHQTRHEAGAPQELKEVKWPGVTELRKTAADVLCDMAEQLARRLPEMNPYDFALEFLPLSESQKKKCIALSAELS